MEKRFTTRKKFRNIAERELQRKNIMIIQIANTVYDSVLKYLMYDNRTAKTILSALLKKDIIKIEMSLLRPAIG